MKPYSKRHLRKKNKKRIRKTKKRKSRGGVFNGASYLFDKGLSILQVPPPAPYGNPTLPVNPFPYEQFI